MPRSHRLFAVALVLVGSACAGSDDDGAGSAGSDVTAHASGVTNQSGRGFDLASVKDPIADLFRGSGPKPKSFADVMAALTKNDSPSCGTHIPLVSERAQLLGAAQPFRAVFVRSCGTSRVMLSPMQSVTASGPAPTDVEIIALDETKKVFDFYSLESGEVRFMGTSIDMLDGPGSGSGGSQERRCANCHTGGAPVMKELILPWANWDGPTGIHFNGGTTSPGSEDAFQHLVTALGLPKASSFHATGDLLQNTVQEAAQTWNPTRLATLAKKDTPSLLRPLFCTVDVNLQTAPSLHQPMGAFDGDFFVNSGRFNIFTSPTVQMTNSAYTSAVNAHQKVVDESGAAITASGKKLVDTAFAFNHPFASFADNDYIADVAKVTSDALADAIVSVDLTTPVFSDRRCGLVAHVPKVPVDTEHPAAYAKAITDGLVANLKAASAAKGSPEAELLANLQDSAGPQPRVTAFLNACAARATKDPKGLMLDALTVESLRRARFRKLPIFEHRELLPDDDLKPAASAHLDPVDCTLK